MPYITTSRGIKPKEAERLIASICAKTKDSFVARRGVKSISVVARDAVSKGFSKVIIIRKEKGKLSQKTLAVSAHSYRWAK